jgi:hypothetical protein
MTSLVGFRTLFGVEIATVSGVDISSRGNPAGGITNEGERSHCRRFACTVQTKFPPLQRLASCSYLFINHMQAGAE